LHDISALSNAWDFDELAQEFSNGLSEHSSTFLKGRLGEIKADLLEKLQNQLEPLFTEDEVVENASKLCHYLSDHIGVVFDGLSEQFKKSAADLHLQRECEAFESSMIKLITSTIKKSFSEPKVKRLIKLK
jgi:hypothetical protein